MRRVIGLLGFIVVFLSSYAFAQQTVELEGVIARIPPARILDWEGATPTVNGDEGWQEQALSVDDEVCCPSGQTGDKFVFVALNRSADNLVRLSSGACLTINTITDNSVSEVEQDSGESLFDLGFLEQGSTFELGTSQATIGVIGTAFRLIAGVDRTFVEVVEGSVEVTDTTTDDSTLFPPFVDPDAAEEGTTYTCNEDETMEIIENALNTVPGAVSVCVQNCNDDVKTCKNECPPTGKLHADCVKGCGDEMQTCKAVCP